MVMQQSIGGMMMNTTINVNGGGGGLLRVRQIAPWAIRGRNSFHCLSLTFHCRSNAFP